MESILIVKSLRRTIHPPFVYHFSYGRPIHVFTCIHYVCIDIFNLQRIRAYLCVRLNLTFNFLSFCSNIFIVIINSSSSFSCLNFHWAKKRALNLTNKTLRERISIRSDVTFFALLISELNWCNLKMWSNEKRIKKWEIDHSFAFNFNVNWENRTDCG